jgi:hypothetical protein
VQEDAQLKYGVHSYGWVNGRFWRILLQKSVEGFREQ